MTHKLAFVDLEGRTIWSAFLRAPLKFDRDETVVLNVKCDRPGNYQVFSSKQVIIELSGSIEHQTLVVVEPMEQE